MQHLYSPLCIRLYLLLLLCGASFQVHSQTESEPNNGFATANWVAYSGTISGGACAPDIDDYFKSSLPAGTQGIRIVFTGNMVTTGQTGGVYLYVYDKFQQQLDNIFIPLTSASRTDTLNVHCFEGDTFYIRVYNYSNQAQCKSYSLNVLTSGVFTLQNDAEVNDGFAQSINLPFQKDTSGHLGSHRYIGGSAANDIYDYYRCVLPPGGKSLRLIMDTRMAVAGTTGGVYYYFYDKYFGQLSNTFISLTGTSRRDTFDFDCFEGDTFYVVVYNYSNQATCKEYKIRTEYTNRFTVRNDQEVNDSYAAAIPLPFQKDTSGHLGSLRALGSSSNDIYDYYRVVLPAGGKTIRLTTSTRMVSSSSGGVYYYLYNKYQNQLTNHFVGLNSSFVNDTLDYDCFEGDTFYVVVYNYGNQSSCKEYRLRVDYTNRFSVRNDAEVNDNFATAIPLPFQKDTTGHLGSQRYLASASNDIYDYYRVVLPAGGKSLRLITKTRMVQPGETGGVYFYFHNKFQGQLTNRFYALTNTFRTDTLDFDCFEGDTFYVQVYNYSNQSACKEYSLKLEYTNHFSVNNDAEPNDDFAAAVPIVYGTNTSGHLGSERYIGNSAPNDIYDMYRCVVPAGNKSLRLITSTRMVLPGTNGGVYYYFYNKFGTQIDNKYVALTDQFVADTFDYDCFEGDTFFVRVYNYSNQSACKEYQLRVQSTGHFSKSNDTEPNETLATAVPVSFGGSVTGNLGSSIYTSTGARNDVDDYYRFILPNNGKGLRLVTRTRMVVPGTAGGMYYYVYNKNNVSLGNQYLPLNDQERTDTLEFPCLDPDTFYVRVYNYSNQSACKEYSVSLISSKSGPVQIAIDHTRFGNNFSFMNSTRNASRYNWNFGDGKTDTVAAPTHLFGNGTFIVTLSATNTCGTRQFRDTLKIDGVEKYTPTSAGTDIGMGAFAIRIFGAGLDSNASVLLKKGGNSYTPFKRRSPSQAELTALFDFKTVPPGVYELEIGLTGGLKFNYPNGFEVFIDSPGFHVRTEIGAPSRVRTSSENVYTVKVWNDKGRIANGVQLFIAVPRGVSTNIPTILGKKSGKLNLKGSTYDMLSLDRDGYNQLYYQGTFNPDVDTFEVDYNKLYSAYDSMVSYDFDSLFGESYRGTMYPIYIPMIPAKGAHTISFKAKTPINGNYEIRSFVVPWSTRLNPLSGEALEYIHDKGLQAAAIAELTPNPALKAVGKSAGYVDIGSQILFTEYFDWYYGVNNADDEFYAKQGLALSGEVAGELLPFGNKTDDAYDQISLAKRQIKRRTDNLHMDQDLILSGIKDPHLAKRLSDDLNLLKSKIAEAGTNLTTAQKEAAINAFLQFSAKQGLKLTQQEVADLLFPDEIAKRNVSSVTSMDPNAIYGPEGSGTPRYMKSTDGLGYEIQFENVDTALVPAQVVRVQINLDTMKYDLRKTTLGQVSIAGKVYAFEDDRQEYFRDIDLRPGKDMIVRVNARIDTLNGRLYWEFLSLDPATMNLTTDVDDGFLPPNKTAPEGQGSVYFQTRYKSGIQTKDTVLAKSEIFFDENMPILTNDWVNTIDDRAPVTMLNPVIQVTGDSLMALTISGTDAESGFDHYELFAKIGDSAWAVKSFPVFEDGLKVIGSPGQTYSFYVVGVDRVGNREKKTASAEATVTLPRITPPVGPESMIVYPNPAGKQISVGLNSPKTGPVGIRITDIHGRKVMEANSEHAGGTAQYLVQTSWLGAGIYFVEVEIAGQNFGSQKIVIIP